MACLIACFSEESISRVSEKWIRCNGRKSYYPKTKIAMRIKTEAEVDKKSNNLAGY